MFLYITLLLIGSIWQSQAVPATCTAAYAARANSTYCMEDSSDFTTGGVSDADKATILQVHNDFRSAVNPTATNMEKMVWSDVLAGIAQKWSQVCASGHDPDRWTEDYNAGSGQNAAWGYGTWTAAITAWHAEVSDFTYGTGATPSGAVIGHFTQVVQDGASIIGCGYAWCGHHVYMCNYKEGNYGIAKPYKSGTSCADCPNKCVNNLCDCGGLYCHNGGTKDIATCTCTCQNAYEGTECLTEKCPGLRCENHGTINTATCTCDCYNNGVPYTGTTCSTKVCPFTVGSSCSSRAQSDCTSYWNIPFWCPYKCGVCTEAERPTCAEDPKCHESSHGCFYMGDQPDAATCATQGNGGLDKSACETKGGGWGCDECTRYSNVNGDCPVMCAYCPDPVCGSKICRNGGSLDAVTCVCTCQEGFSGDTCESASVVCNGLTCLNGGVLDTTACSCGCVNGYTGTTCDTAPCAGKVCQNGGALDTGTCVCQCTSEYEGDTCQSLILCNGLTCLNGGVLDTTACTCGCVNGYTGTTCETAPVVCNGLTCLNGGVLDTTACTCGCVNGYTGTTCDTEECSGIVCENHGTLDTSTCTCDCYDVVYSGTTCSTKTCPFVESSSCSQWTQTDCTSYWNVPFWCPYTCGLCTEAERPASCSDDPNCHESAQQCYHIGEQPSAATCATYGEEGLDSGYCVSQGGSWGCDDCSTYYNVKTDYCPVMCAYCPHPVCGAKGCRNGGSLDDVTCVCTCAQGFAGETCETVLCDGLTCLNGGVLDTTACTCGCANGYTGTTCDTATCTGVCQNHGTMDYATCKCDCYTFTHTGDLCETLVCPFREDSYCPNWGEGYCAPYWNVPLYCPYMCGLCQESDRPTCDADPNCHISAHGCTHMGAQADAASCATYGVNGDDHWICASKGGSWPCDDCTTFSNVKWEYCPLMCAYCPGG